MYRTKYPKLLMSSYHCESLIDAFQKNIDHSLLCSKNCLAARSRMPPFCPYYNHLKSNLKGYNETARPTIAHMKSTTKYSSVKHSYAFTATAKQ